MLEARVKRLEEDVAEIKLDLRGLRSDVADLRVEVAGMKGRLNELPTYAALVTVAGLIVAANGAVIVAATYFLRLGG